MDELVSRVRSACLSAFDNQELPFEEVVRGLDPPRRAGHNPYFDHLFSFHDTPGDFVGVPGLEVDVVDVVSNRSAKADLNVIVVNQRGRGVSADRPRAENSRSCGSTPATSSTSRPVTDTLTAYLNILEQLLDPGAPRLSELESGDARPALSTWSLVHPTHYESDDSIDQVFAERVRERPDGRRSRRDPLDSPTPSWTAPRPDWPSSSRAWEWGAGPALAYG